MTPEVALREYAKKAIERAGGIVLPWVAPGNTGVPDRLVFWPDNVVHLVEFKAKRGRLRPRQKIVRDQLDRVAWEIQFLLNSQATVDQYVEAHSVAGLSATSA
jgi:hypothetical protein